MKAKKWKAWAAFDSGGEPFVVRFTEQNCEHAVIDLPLSMTMTIRPVLITLAPPKRAAKKP